MGATQGEEDIMVERGREDIGGHPGVGPVAEFALDGERCFYMVGNGTQPIVVVTAKALERDESEVEGRRIAVTGQTIESSMSPGQGKECGVVKVGQAEARVARQGVVAVVAAEPENSKMGIDVAVGAGATDIGEHELSVTGGASERGVHPLQDKTRSFVAEESRTPERFPARGRMTVRARDGQLSVRGFSPGLCSGRQTAEHRQHQPREYRSPDGSGRLCSFVD